MRAADALTLERLGAGVVVVSLAGDHDVSSAPMLRERLSGVLAERDAVVVDLAATTSLDSAILGVLLGALRRGREQGSPFALVIGDGHEGRVRRIFELTGLLAIFPVFGDRLLAVEALGARRR